MSLDYLKCSHGSFAERIEVHRTYDWQNCRTFRYRIHPLTVFVLFDIQSSLKNTFFPCYKKHKSLKIIRDLKILVNQFENNTKIYWLTKKIEKNSGIFKNKRRTLNAVKNIENREIWGNITNPYTRMSKAMMFETELPKTKRRIDKITKLYNKWIFLNFVCIYVCYFKFQRSHSVVVVLVHHKTLLYLIINQKTTCVLKADIYGDI